MNKAGRTLEYGSQHQPLASTCMCADTQSHEQNCPMGRDSWRDVSKLTPDRGQISDHNENTTKVHLVKV